MAEELGPIQWWIWLRDNTADKRKVMAVTRLQAIQRGANELGGKFENVDYEVVR